MGESSFENMGGTKDIFRCGCGHEVIAVDHDVWLHKGKVEFREVCISMYDAATGCSLWADFRWRLGLVWKLLRSGRSQGDAFMMTPDTALRVGDAIIRHATEAAAIKGGADQTPRKD